MDNLLMSSLFVVQVVRALKKYDFVLPWKKLTNRSIMPPKIQIRA